MHYMQYHQWDKLPNKSIIDKAAIALISNGINVNTVKNGKEALEYIIKLIPPDALVMDGGSTTLKQIGFLDYLDDNFNKWKNLHKDIYSENDEIKRLTLRRTAVTADYFLGSVNAITIDGKLMLADRSGTRVSAYSFAAKKVIIVASANKIVDSLEMGRLRIIEHALPLEDKRMRNENNSFSAIAKWLIIEKEFIKDRITLIIITDEQLGF